MVYRLVNLPLIEDLYEKEKNRIYEVASVNGYQKSMVNRILRKMTRKKQRLNRSTMFKENQEEKKHLVLPLPYNNISSSLAPGFKEKFTVIYKSGNSLGSILGSTKDKVATIDQKGVYKINCTDCDACYIDQTRRSIKKRVQEHFQEFQQKHH